MKFKEQADKLYSKLISEEVEGKTIYYRKRQVYPPFDLEGNINWFNFLVGGKWSNLGIAILIVAVTLGVIYEYHANLSQCSDVMSEINMYKNLVYQINLSEDAKKLTWDSGINLSNFINNATGK